MKKLTALIEKGDSHAINDAINMIIDFINLNDNTGVYKTIIDETYNRKVVERFYNKMPISYELYYDNELVSGSFNYYIEDNRKYTAYISSGKRMLFLEDIENHILDKWVCE